MVQQETRYPESFSGEWSPNHDTILPPSSIRRHSMSSALHTRAIEMSTLGFQQWLPPLFNWGAISMLLIILPPESILLLLGKAMESHNNGEGDCSGWLYIKVNHAKRTTTLCCQLQFKFILSHCPTVILLFSLPTIHQTFPSLHRPCHSRLQSLPSPHLSFRVSLPTCTVPHCPLPLYTS